MPLNKNKYLIITGRFQPLHSDHLNLFKTAINKFGYHLIVCVLRNRFESYKGNNNSKITSFENLSSNLQSITDNPIPNWERLELINIAIRNDKVLKDKVTVILRDPANLDWENSIKDLPINRIWVFNTNNSEFDKTKVEFYLSKGEDIVTVENATTINSTEIRRRIRNGENSFNFLPLPCMIFFNTNCKKYIINNIQ